METLWYALVALMLTAYAVLDGWDFGAGALHLFVAKDDRERREVLAAIGPFWDGNEVWLIASGGVLFFTFPRAYAVAFSGFYLPLMIVLWLLILRGVAIEVRSLEANPLWRAFFDATFALSSAGMAIVLGCSLGNVIRGVPLSSAGDFHVPLFTDFTPGRDAGVLDWYTVLVGLFTLCALAAHGARFLAWKTEGALRQRAVLAGRRLWPASLLLLTLCTLATARVQPALYASLAARPWAWPLPLIATLGLVIALRARGERTAFLGSCAFLTGLLAATAAGLYPNLLVSTISTELNVTVANSASGAHGLAVGLGWWVLGIPLAIGYFAYLFRSFAGKIRAGSAGH